MNTKILLVVVLLSHVVCAKVGINTQNPKAWLEVIEPNNESMPPVKLDLEKRYEEIDYLTGRDVMIDKNGYLYKERQTQIAKGIYNGRKTITKQNERIEICSYSDLGSTVRFSFFTNFSLGSGNGATLHATISYGRVGGFFVSNLVGGTDKEPDEIGTINSVNININENGERVHQLDIKFSEGGRELRLIAKKDGTKGVVISAECIDFHGLTTSIGINIYDSLVTRFIRD